jgi:hypothetical protein
MEATKILFLEDTGSYKKGTTIENCFPTIRGVLDEQGNLIKKKNFIYLTEKLSKEDEEKVKALIKEMLKLVLWRMYTRSSFITQ